MNLLFDANISWRIIKILREHFTTVSHANEINLSQPAKDIEIWNFCKNHNFIIITHDDDFEKLALTKGFPPKVIILKTFNKSTVELANLIINKKEVIESFIFNEEQSILEIY